MLALPVGASLSSSCLIHASQYLAVVASINPFRSGSVHTLLSTLTSALQHNASCPVNQKDLTAEKFATFLCDWASDVFCQDGALKHRLLRGRGRLFTHKVFAHKDWCARPASRVRPLHRWPSTLPMLRRERVQGPTRLPRAKRTPPLLSYPPRVSAHRKAFAERVYAAEDAAPPSLPGLEAAAPLLAMELTAIRLHNRAVRCSSFNTPTPLRTEPVLIALICLTN